jgi:hypothetical protein
MKLLDIFTILATVLFTIFVIITGLFLAVSFIDGLIYLIVMNYTFIIFIIAVIMYIKLIF